MRVAETSGRTVDEAVGKALGQLGLRRDQVDVDVITEGKGGFLGFGSEEAIVRVTAKESAVAGGATQRGGERGGQRGGQRGGRERSDGPRDGGSTEGAEGGGRRRGRRGGRGRGGRDAEGGRPEGARTDGGRPEGARADAGPRDERPRDDRPREDSPREERPRDDRGGRDARGGRGRSGGGRPERGDRPDRGERAPRGPFQSVPDDELVLIPGAPDDVPAAPTFDEATDDMDLAGSSLRDILTLLGYTGTEITARDPETPGDGTGLIEQVFDIYGEDDDTSDDLGVLIGRRGETLASLQYLVNTIVSKGGNKPPVFGLDIEGYRRRREQMLVDLAHEIAQEVRETGDVITLEPMPAYERRIVHIALREERGVKTESVGSGDERQVEVLPE
ncbi:MAG: Jag N-terminal domain-containing protein [Dehalococcoidia bacterium]